ncbi:MAG: DUF5752 family protein [Nitrososphaerota archaeon]|jgi:DNA-binding transcriptional ArsR family regulator|nr:DUF5752 family protein [Nitrososphaerota archaeon]
MSLSPAKQEILESMLLNENPQTATDIAKDIQKELQSVTMHLLGLRRMNYVTLPQKGLYTITECGKQALGLPQITKEKATAILSYAPHDRAFNFYVTIDKPLSVHAHNLRDFTTKLPKVSTDSIEFHLQRSDFEAWFRDLGDEELVKKILLLKQKNLSGDVLRKKLETLTKCRYVELSKLTGAPIIME